MDAVKIVTCHASKGLEYPVVFLVESDGKIYNKDRASRLAFSEDFGISFRLRTPSGLAVVNNPVQDIINDRILRKLYEEELRVLYVALTRARERLFVVGECPTIKRDEYLMKISVIRENLSEYSFRRLASYQEIILACDISSSVAEGDYATFEKNENVSEIDTRGSENATKSQKNEEITAELARRFSFKYPNIHLTELPEKMSVSKMSPTVLDGTDEESVLFEITTEDSADGADVEEKKMLPSFILGTKADESAKRGIATHLLMQFCDINNLQVNGAAEELKRLCDLGFLSADDAARVRLYEIEMFRKSRLFSDMLKAKKIYRELRFNIRLPATEFTREEEKIFAYKEKDILVQGVIDCIIEEIDGSISIYDYKTDRLTQDELANRALAEKTLREKHSTQLKLYALAVEKIFEKAPKKIEVYSLALGDTVSIK